MQSAKSIGIVATLKHVKCIMRVLYKGILGENFMIKKAIFYLIPDYKSRQEPNILKEFWVNTL